MNNVTGQNKNRHLTGTGEVSSSVLNHFN